jgi:hypothetical protein
MPSEGDAPFAPFTWPGPDPLTPAALCAHLGLPPETPVEVGDAHALLDQLAQEQDWFGAEERAVAARFATLHAVFNAHVTDFTCYRLGQIQITLIIAGRAASGAVLGLQTTVIET